MQPQQVETVAVIGAGDYIGAAIMRRFATEGLRVHGCRRAGDKMSPLVDEIKESGGCAFGHSVDARDSDALAAFLADVEQDGPLHTVIFNIGGNVNFPIRETTDRVFRKVWEMACFAGFVTAREAARIMVPRGAGNLFFTGATASLRGGKGYAAFAAAKAGLKMVAESTARELGPEGIHVAHLIVDAAVDTEWVRDIIKERTGETNPTGLMPPESVADAYWTLASQPRDAWTFEQIIRPFGETW